MELTLWQLNNILTGMTRITDTMMGNKYGVLDDKNMRCSNEAIETPVMIIQGNQVKKLQRIAADVEDGKIKAWELIFQEAGRK